MKTNHYLVIVALIVISLTTVVCSFSSTTENTDVDVAVALTQTAIAQQEATTSSTPAITVEDSKTDEQTGTVIVTFLEPAPLEMPVVYLINIDTAKYYKDLMPAGPSLNQLTFEVAPGNYQVEARSNNPSDPSYYGYWQEGGGLTTFKVESGEENSFPGLTLPDDPCSDLFQLPASPDNEFEATTADCNPAESESTSATGVVKVSFSEPVPSGVQVVYLINTATEAYYSQEFNPADINNVTLEVPQGFYQIYARDIEIDLAYSGYWQAEGGLQTINLGSEYDIVLSGPADPCQAAYFLPPSPDGRFINTDDLRYQERYGCPAQADTDSTTTKPNLLWLPIPAGNFTMGSSKADIEATVKECNDYEGNCQTAWFKSETPQRTESSGTFEMTILEITNVQYNLCVKNGPCPPPRKTSSDNSITLDDTFFNDNYPVVSVTKADAAAFCSWVGGRLPSEQEWEKAARGTDGRRYPWGNELDLAKANLNSKGPKAVGSYDEGGSPYAILDMAGNVAEFTSDNVIRGGSWKNPPHQGRTTQRSTGAWLTQDFTNFDLGFRCVK